MQNKHYGLVMTNFKGLKFVLLLFNIANNPKLEVIRKRTMLNKIDVSK